MFEYFTLCCSKPSLTFKIPTHYFYCLFYVQSLVCLQNKGIYRWTFSFPLKSTLRWLVIGYTSQLIATECPSIAPPSCILAVQFILPPFRALRLSQALNPIYFSCSANAVCSRGTKNLVKTSSASIQSTSI